MIEYIKKFWKFLNQDTWQAWLVSLVLAFIIIKFIFFPLLSFALGTSLPLVVVESCSMYHKTGNLEDWWANRGVWYNGVNITEDDFSEYSFNSGLNKGDIILVYGRGEVDKGDVIIFNTDAGYKYPIIHRVVSVEPLETKGDNNPAQLSAERGIEKSQIVGKAVVRIPAIGWVKLILFEFMKPQNERGLCH